MDTAATYFPCNLLSRKLLPMCYTFCTRYTSFSFTYSSILPHVSLGGKILKGAVALRSKLLHSLFATSINLGSMSMLYEQMTSGLEDMVACGYASSLGFSIKGTLRYRNLKALNWAPNTPIGPACFVSTDLLQNLLQRCECTPQATPSLLYRLLT